MLYGLLAALGFGLADLTTAITARRIGTFATLLIGQVSGMVLILVYIALAHPSLGGASRLEWTLMLLGGVAAGLGYFALYRGLELGPIALVSPIVTGDAAFGVVLFVIVLHESLSVAAAAGVAITIAGVVLAATNPRGLTRGRPILVASGVPFALVSMVFFTLGLFAAGVYTKSLGWFLPMLTSRIGTMAVLVAFLVARRAKDLRVPIPPRLGAMAVAVGVLDLLGFAAFTRGTEVGLASIVTAASATFPLIPVAGGVMLMGERPVPTQALGIAMVVGGLVLLGLAR